MKILPRVVQDRSWVERFFATGLVQFQFAEPAEIDDNRRRIAEISDRLAGAPLSSNTFCQERYFPGLFAIASHPVVLDAVEAILGPNFFLWGTHVLSKGPGHVGYSWHQDRPHFPLRYADPTRHRIDDPVTVTAWVAIDDADIANGAFAYVPGSHLRGAMPHETVPIAGLDGEGITEISTIDRAVFDPESDRESVLVTYNELPAGHVSLHHDLLIHGSGPNRSSRRRTGVSIHYSRSDVVCDASVWPNLRVRMMRGVDHDRLNPTWTEFVSVPVSLDQRCRG